MHRDGPEAELARLAEELAACGELEFVVEDGFMGKWGCGLLMSQIVTSSLAGVQG
jgi:hypothetical protein